VDLSVKVVPVLMLGNRIRAELTALTSEKGDNGYSILKPILHVPADLVISSATITVYREPVLVFESS